MSQLKDIYTPTFLSDFAEQVSRYQPSFSKNSFVTSVLANDWAALSVRQRMHKIATSLGDHLTGEYPEKLDIILQLHKANTGFNFLFLPDFVSIYGLDNKYFDLSLTYLKKLTPYSSAEFAIRPFFQADSQRVLSFLEHCSLDQDEHVRRLASEGSRPRLPWGSQLKEVIDDPSLTLTILSNLRSDHSLYVRKSVANHLNDFSKHDPDFVITVCREWSNQTPETDWIIRKACRTMIKNAYGPALSLFGYDSPGTTFSVLKSHISLPKETVKVGDYLDFTFDIQTTIQKETLLRLEYGVNYMKANGKMTLKKFHISDNLVSQSHFSGTKRLSFKDLSTRKHYKGPHELLLFCNGTLVACNPFTLI